ncbi:hypothetical protein [Streptomyces sp. NPDC048638]|uniref:hypothetical protein n=1 Tax=Streptomyces sp. NPDC048638 TaxID=3365580 RepID=UPI003722086A
MRYGCALAPSGVFPVCPRRTGVLIGEGDKVLYLFDGGRLSSDLLSQIKLQADELRSYDFHHAAELAELTIPRLVRRITVGTRAHEGGVTAYLEHGAVPGAEWEPGRHLHRSDHNPSRRERSP